MKINYLARNEIQYIHGGGVCLCHYYNEKKSNEKISRVLNAQLENTFESIEQCKSLCCNTRGAIFFAYYPHAAEYSLYSGGYCSTNK